MPTDPAALLADVYADPASDAKRLVYADALVEKGDPLGEFIQLQLQKGKRASKGRFSPSWWSERHPAGILGRVLDHHCRRGFPAKFFVSTLQKMDGWRAHREHAGWSTIELLSCETMDSGANAELLAAAPLLSLEEVRWVDVAGLKAIAARDLPIRTLFVSASPAETPSLARLMKLRSLEWNDRDVSTSAAVAATKRIGVLDRLLELILWNRPRQPIRAALDALAKLPANVKRLTLSAPVTYVLVDRSGKLAIALDGKQASRAAEELAKIPASEASALKLEVKFVAGYVDKGARAGLAAEIKKAVKRFKSPRLFL